MNSVKRSGIFPPGDRVDVTVNNIEADPERDFNKLMQRVDQELYALRRNVGMADNSEESITLDEIKLDKAEQRSARIESPHRQALLVSITEQDEVVASLLYEQNKLYDMSTGVQSEAYSADDDGLQAAQSLLLIMRTLDLMQRAEEIPLQDPIEPLRIVL